MEEAKEDNSNEKKRLDRSGARSKLLNINPGALRLYKTIFELLVDGEDGDYVKLKLLKTKIRVALLPVLGKVFSSTESSAPPAALSPFCLRKG